MLTFDAEQKMKALGFRPIEELTQDGLDVLFLLWNGREVWGCLCIGVVSPASRTYWSKHEDLGRRPPVGFKYTADVGSYRREAA